MLNWPLYALATKVSYKESIGVRGDRIAPTIGDLARVRDFKGLKDLIHKPRTTMILDHAPHAVEILKLGSLHYEEFKNFVHTVEDVLFELTASRANNYASLAGVTPEGPRGYLPGRSTAPTSTRRTRRTRSTSTCRTSTVPTSTEASHLVVFICRIHRPNVRYRPIAPLLPYN